MKRLTQYLLVVLIAWPGLALAALSPEEKQMGLAIRTSLQEAGTAFKADNNQLAGSKIEEAMQQLDLATQTGSAELFDALLPMIGQLEKAHALLISKGEDLSPFELPLRPANPHGDPAAEAKYIDQLIAAKLKEKGQTPLPPANDEVFLRRIYLDLAGRIPSYEEAEAFLRDSDPDKRANLIDTLLDSPAYVSNFLNFWSDILRIRSKLTKNNSGQPYHDWVRKALMQNKPYDQFVSELITARGYLWENGAAGFYIRDNGMPLDHLAMASQVFLGTQLQCAQCHDHPYDDWTQMDFYRLAAFTYGVETENKQFDAKRLAGEYGFGLERKNQMYGLIKDYVTPLNSRTHYDSEAVLKLPVDYQYDDGKPFDPIEPNTLFGDNPETAAGEDPSIALAQWMTSSDNARFTLVIANRLWKKVMGAGLFEPIDDLSAASEPSNELLMTFLTKQMQAYDYDMKQYLRLLFRTGTYQRETYAEEFSPGSSFHFPGPVYRRMTAEQAWDSLVTLIVPDLDKRHKRQQISDRQLMAQGLVGRSKKEVLPVFLEQVDRRPLLNKMEDLEHQLYRARIGKGKRGGPENIKKAEEAIAKLQKELDAVPGLTVFLDDSPPESQDPLDRQLAEARLAANTDPRFAHFEHDLRRASELPNPAPEGHFLREFGQSDRELIENASNNASITQILTLLNSSYFEKALTSKSTLMNSLENVDRPEDKIRVIYLSLLTREPTSEEVAICHTEVKTRGDSAYRDIVWALLNTRQFTFVN
ncbi:MAG: DUF1549 domain-containing protein [Verrucomicrobiota bacterium]